MKEYRLDKTVFKMQTFEEADMDNVFEDNVPLDERLRQAYYLTSIAYNFSLDNPPPLEKNLFSMRKFKENA